MLIVWMSNSVKFHNAVGDAEARFSVVGLPNWWFGSTGFFDDHSCVREHGDIMRLARQRSLPRAAIPMMGDAESGC
jgi:hypothetical protein